VTDLRVTAMMQVNALVWRLPKFLHDAIVWLTGYRLVRHVDNRSKRVVGYTWSSTYPLKAPEYGGVIRDVE